jgi:hypothetical protein
MELVIYLPHTGSTFTVDSVNILKGAATTTTGARGSVVG